MSIEQIVNVPENGQVTVKIPDFFKNRKQVRLIFNTVEESLESKILLLRKASLDKDFLADQEQVNNCFVLSD